MTWERRGSERGEWEGEARALEGGLLGGVPHTGLRQSEVSTG